MNGSRKGACDVIHQREDIGTDHICALDAYNGNRANAELIAAAPDLLAALRDMLAAYQNTGGRTQFKDAARLAIAKAMGEAL
jgi:hypothetical protein